MIERNKAQDVSVTIEKDGSEASPTSATFTLYQADGTKVIDETAATISGGTVTGSVAAADTDGKTLGRAWLVKFDITIASKVYTVYNDAVLSLARLYPPIGQTDLVSRHSDVAALVSTSKGNLQDYITSAWAELIGRMYADSVPFWQIRTPSSLREYMFARCYALIFRDYATLLDPGDRYMEHAERYEMQADKAYDQIQSRIDLGEDNILEADAKPVSPVIMLSSGPRRRY
jgi:hypothetical protein